MKHWHRKAAGWVMAGLLVCGMAAIAATGMADGKPAAPAQAKPGAWEHLALTHDLAGGLTDAQLARKIVQLGRDGWEMVCVTHHTKAGTTTKTVYYFKRPAE